jgi:hypothetical protein
MAHKLGCRKADFRVDCVFCSELHEIPVITPYAEIRIAASLGEPAEEASSANSAPPAKLP